MLRELTRLLETHGTLSVPELARRLGVGEGTVRLMLTHLARQGRLRPLTPTCGAHHACAGCTLQGLCEGGKGTPQVWEITPEDSNSPQESS